MPFKAKKLCRFGGIDYIIGSLIPDEAVDPSQVTRLENSGYIEKQVVAETTVPPAPPSLPSDDKQPGEGDKTSYTEKQLTDMKKDDLVALATQLNIEVGEDMTKKQIAAVIMTLQEESDAEKQIQDKQPSEGDA